MTQDQERNKEKICRLLAEFFKDEPWKIGIWLLTKNPNFGGISPAWLINMDRGHKVLRFIESAREGNIA